MSDDIAVKLEKRTQVGKGLNHLRTEGKIPAVIHNHGEDSTIVAGSYIELSKAYAQAGKSHPITVDVDGKKQLTIIKDADFEPKKNRLRHLVFNAIKRDEKVTAEVPIVVEGDVPAEHTGLLVLHTLDKISIEALPENLIDSLKVSGENLKEVGDKLHVSDLVVPAGVTVLAEPDQTIITIDQPRAQVSEEAAEEGEGEGEESEDSKSTEGDGGGDAQAGEDAKKSDDNAQQSKD